MTSEQRRLTFLVSESLAQLAPLIDRACEALDRPGTRDLRNRIAKNFHYALTVHDAVVRCDETEAFDGLGPHTAPRLRSRGHLSLVVNNTLGVGAQ